MWRTVTVVGLLALIGCSREGDMVPLDDAATAAGIPKMATCSLRDR